MVPAMIWKAPTAAPGGVTASRGTPAGPREQLHTKYASTTVPSSTAPISIGQSA